MVTVHLVRHTAPAVEVGVCYGRLDLPLAASATADLDAALANVPTAAHLYTSPALRCRRLADAIAARDGLAVSVQPHLHELDFGAWEGRRWDDLPREDIDRWAQAVWIEAPGGGESLSQLWARVSDFIQTSLRPLNDTVTIVAHHGPLRALRAQLLGLGPSAYWETEIPFGGCVSLHLASPIGDYTATPTP